MLKAMVRVAGGDRPVQVKVRHADGDKDVRLGWTGKPQPVVPPPAPRPEPQISAPQGTFVDGLLAKNPFYVAHRLGGAEYPEMTMAGLQASINAGFMAFEYSVFRSRDGVYVGSHDWTTKRTSGVRHEIWDTDWSTIRQLQQATGPFTRLEEIVEALPKGAVLFLDHKATSSKPAGNSDEQRSEKELFDLVERLFPDPSKQVVWKLFSASTADQRARQRGIRTNCMLYRSEVASADLSRWDVLGMEWNAPDEYWKPLRDTGKPTIAHIIDQNTGQRDQAMQRGTQGFMSSLPTLVSPKTHPTP
ncbi:glycerophosphodiester phosphodiesterase [Corynebacterium cystitidis]|uniref:glycerophosphodiester phosphodiesterase n=1 Tax=Corynebacterium cystitidis TaxID=35757 RepID=UPI00211E9FE8|nr:glycerophosphodiester phosphodiesterase family protein [Corynebacterium cystitidis]